MASSSLATASTVPAAPHFEKRTLPAPELPGLCDVVSKMNKVWRSPEATIKDLTKAKTHFEKRISDGKQTELEDSIISGKVLRPILHSENARSPGLNAVDCSCEEDMVDTLRKLSKAGEKRQGGLVEGHVRFHLGIWDDTHRVAVDAFQHGKGGFTLVGVDSAHESLNMSQELEQLCRYNADLLKGSLALPTHNLVHREGCRIFAIHHLNALHDYQPHIRNLHREIYNKAQGRPAPRLSDPMWNSLGENTHTLNDAKDAFGLLPGKFFKHMQVKKPKSDTQRTWLDDAEDRNPALKDQPVNKHGQTLRARFESLNPEKRPEDFERHERTLSMDKKRLVLIDRAIAHYERLAAQPPAP